MTRIVVFTKVDAPIDRVFDLSRSIDLHFYTQKMNGKLPKGDHHLMELGRKVTLKAGRMANLTSQITEYDRPHYVRDSQIRGVFKQFDHDQFFSQEGDGVMVKDVVEYTASLGFIGQAANLFYYERHMELLMQRRGLNLKRVAESAAWKEYLNEED